MTPSPAADAANRSRSVLEEERDFFLRSLRDLEAERAAGDIDEHDYLALRDDYTVRAAQILRQLGGAGNEAPPAPPLEPDGAGGPGLGDRQPGGDPAVPLGPDEGSVAPRGDVPSGDDGPSGVEGAKVPSPWRKRILLAVAVVLIVGGVVWAVSAAAGVRLPGEGVSGSNAVQQTTQQIVEAEAAYADGNAVQAMRDYEGVLRTNPNNVEALTGEGAILVQVGESGRNRALVDRGLSQLGKAEIVNPSYGVAYGYRGLGYYYEGNDRAAVPQLEAYLSDTPAKSRVASISSTLVKAKKKLAAGGG